MKVEVDIWRPVKAWVEDDPFGLYKLPVQTFALDEVVFKGKIENMEELANDIFRDIEIYRKMGEDRVTT